MIDFKKVYKSYLDTKNEENRLERYQGNEHWYGASASGSCHRKLYFKNVQKIEPTDEIKDESYRKMRLGTIFHDDMEKALEQFNENNDGEQYFSIEEEFKMPDLNVRGFADAVYVHSDGSVYLYDFKTAATYPWKKKFGRYGQPRDARYELQLSTYGIGVLRKYGRLDGMELVYYNKDTSDMRSVEVPMETLEKAEKWWKNLKEVHDEGLPRLLPGISPSASWECNYCEWKTHCMGL